MPMQTRLQAGKGTIPQSQDLIGPRDNQATASHYPLHEEPQ